VKINIQKKQKTKQNEYSKENVILIKICRHH